MSALENIIAMVVLMGLFLAAFTIITGLNTSFFVDVVDYSVKEYNKEKYENDLDAVLNTTEPVSKNNYADLLADAVYYRRKYFDYNADADLNFNEEIRSYYNTQPPDLSYFLDKNVLQVDELTELTFDKLYGNDNYYLEISPLFVKLRLYFVIDGSASLENEVEGLKRAIPSLIEDFNSEFEVAARVYVLAEGGLDQLDPCADLEEHAQCKYLYKEEMYSNQVTNGWLMNTWEDSWRTDSRYRDRGPTWVLSSLLSGWPFYIGGEPSFSESHWEISTDEFLDESTSDVNRPTFFCSWVELSAENYDSFQIQVDFNGDAGVRMNDMWHNASLLSPDSTVGMPIEVLPDFNADSKWQLLCIGYRPGGVRPLVSYSYIATPTGSVERRGYFDLEELHAFRSTPSQYEFAEEIMDRDLSFPGGIFYEDWASASVYAAVSAEKENPSTLTVIIPISDELSLGSEAVECEDLSGFDKVFCERCNKYGPGDAAALECPVERSSEDINRAIAIIQPYGYSVFPVLANSCDVEGPYSDSANLVCTNFFTPYGDCRADPYPVCGQCFGPDVMECPGLTLEGADIHTSMGCDKKHCRDFIQSQMQHFAAETGGEMIELTQINMLYDRISEAIKDTIDRYKIKAGMKKPEEERFVFKKLVPLSNRLFADLLLWHYKHSQE